MSKSGIKRRQQSTIKRLPKSRHPHKPTKVHVPKKKRPNKYKNEDYLEEY